MSNRNTHKDSYILEKVSNRNITMCKEERIYLLAKMDPGSAGRKKMNNTRLAEL